MELGSTPCRTKQHESIGVTELTFARPATGASDVRHPAKSDTTVFVVERDDAIRDSLTVLLKLHDLHVVAFASFDIFRHHAGADHAGCAIVDLETAGMTGHELLRALDRVPFPAPVIMTSIGPGAEIVPPAERERATFLRKPFAAADLFNALWHALETRPIH